MNVRRAAVRLAATGVVAAAVILVLVQFGRMVHGNMVLSQTLSRTRAEVKELRAKRDRDARQIARLRDSGGAIPAIHERLGEVGPHEAIIYLKDAPDPGASASPDPGR